MMYTGRHYLAVESEICTKELPQLPYQNCMSLDFISDHENDEDRSSYIIVPRPLVFM